MILLGWNTTIADLGVIFFTNSTKVNRKLTKDCFLPHLPSHTYKYTLTIGQPDKDGSPITKHYKTVQLFTSTVKGITIESSLLCKTTETKPRLV